MLYIRAIFDWTPVTPHLLIIDDEKNLRELLARILDLEGYTVLQAGTAREAWRVLEQDTIHVVLCDVKLPDAHGVALTQQIKQQYPALEIIQLTAYGTIQDGVQAIKNGAFDYLTKGDDNDKIIPLVAKATEKAILQHRVLHLEQQVTKRFGFGNILGQAPAILEAISLARKVTPTDTTVLLTGETGTGKELFAQAIHYESPRKDKAFVALNCSAIAKDLLESELFGHKSGAFTGAMRDKKGLLEEAHQGSIFLDEIGEMPLELQAKLLRVLETSEFFKVGDSKPTKINVRVIAATNRNLEHEAAQGQFRLDLFYRLSVFQIQLPSLQERKTDIPALCAFFATFFAKKLNKSTPKLSVEFLEKMQQHRWKGNIRELKNVMERAMILCDQPALSLQDLPLEFRLGVSFTEGHDALDLATVEKLHIAKVLHHTQGNKTETARLLGIGLTTLYRKLEEYGLHRG
ncbi:MAG: sigma-54 dependent transcriptional regulator [Spirosomataceae bacterium]